eukprot:ctg_225.g92
MVHRLTPRNWVELAEFAARVLRLGQVVALPTDTVYTRQTKAAGGVYGGRERRVDVYAHRALAAATAAQTAARPGNFATAATRRIQRLRMVRTRGRGHARMGSGQATGDQLESDGQRRAGRAHPGLGVCARGVTAARRSVGAHFGQPQRRHRMRQRGCVSVAVGGVCGHIRRRHAAVSGDAQHGHRPHRAGRVSHHARRLGSRRRRATAARTFRSGGSHREAGREVTRMV